MEKIDLTTPDIAQENVEKLAALFPDVVTEVREDDGSLRHAIDVEALKARVGDIAEDKRERYQFTWPGKQKAKAEAVRPIDKTMRPCPEESVNWDTTQNLYIEGDNLDALKLLRNTYADKIDVIYIDPPYNTGSDLIYRDTFVRSAEKYRDETTSYNEAGERMERNLDTNGAFHSDWCAMIYPRLLLARDLLANDGALFISIDEGEADNLRKIADEVFGESNFIAEMVWSGGRKNDSQFISISHEYILCYVKSSQLLKDKKKIWREKKHGLEPIYEEYASLRQKYGSDDNAIQIELRKWFASLPNDSEAKTHKHYSSVDENGIYFADNISWPGGGGPKYEVLHPVTKKPVSIPSRGWLFGTPERMQEMIAQGRVEFGPDEKKVPCYKRYLKETEYQVPYSVLYKDGRAASKRLAALMGDKVFDNPKDEEILAKLISFPMNKNAVVMDFFAGSGTTAHAVMSQNAKDGGARSFILVQYPEDLDSNFKQATKSSSKKVISNAIALCDSLNKPHRLSVVAAERIRRAGRKIAKEVETSNTQLKLGEEPKKVPDIGFRALKIDSSNFQDVRREPESLDQGTLMGLADNLKPARSAEDLLFQVLPQFQIPYTAPIEKLSINGKVIYNVDDGLLLACFDQNVSTEVVKQMADMQPSYAVLRDASFIGDDAMANFAEVFKTVSPTTITRVV